MRLSRKSNHGHNSVVINISSGHVSTALFRVVGTNVPQCISSATRRFYIGEDDWKTGEKKMLKALDQSLDEVLRHGYSTLREMGVSREIEHMLVTLSAPWSTSRISSREEGKIRKFTFSHELAEKFVREESEWFREDAESRTGDKYRIFDTYISHLSLNGYKEHFPTKKTTNHAVVDIFQSIAPERLLEHLEKEIGKHISPKRGVTTMSFVDALSRSIPLYYREQGKVMVLSMAEFSSEGIIFCHGRAEKIVSVPFGSRSIVSRLAREFYKPVELADSLLSLFSTGDLKDELNEVVDKVASASEEVWQERWQKEGIDKPNKTLVFSPERDGKLALALTSGLWVGGKVVSLSEERLFSRQFSRESYGVMDEELSMLALFSHSLL